MTDLDSDTTGEEDSPNEVAQCDYINYDSQTQTPHPEQHTQQASQPNANNNNPTTGGFFDFDDLERDMTNDDDNHSDGDVSAGQGDGSTGDEQPPPDLAAHDHDGANEQVHPDGSEGTAVAEQNMHSKTRTSDSQDEVAQGGHYASL